MSTETKPNVKKFTEEEIKKLKDIRSQFSDLSYKLGQLEMQKIALEEQKEEIKKTLSATIDLEKKTAKDLIDKYGKGTIDIDSGEFIPLS